MKHTNVLRLFIFQILSLCSLLHLNKAYGQNLLVNADGESGSLSGWVDEDDAWGNASEITPHEGDFFIWPSREAIAYTQLYQDVDVSAYTGTNYFHLSGWMANWDQYPHDKATLAIAIYDNAMNQLAYYFREHRNPFWGFYKIEAELPKNAHTMRVYLIATRFVGSDNDAYFDALSLEINNQAMEYKITITSASGENKIPIGNTLQLSATTTGITDNNYTWSSSYDNIATVSQDGLVTAQSTGDITIQVIGETSQAIGTYTISCYPQENYLIFTNLNEGDELEQATSYELKWMYDGGVSPGTLELSKDDGVTWELQTNIDNLSALRYNWTIPSSEQPINNCRIKISWGEYSSVSQRFSIVEKISTGTGLIQNEKSVSIYPNPGTDKILIKGITANSMVRIYSINGNLVKTIEPTNNLINVSDLTKGSYFIKINDEQSEITKVFIKN